MRLQYKLAPADTAILREETVVDPVSWAEEIDVPETARYVWIRLTLDDTQASDPSQPTTITDIVVGEPLSEPPPGGGPKTEAGSDGGASAGGCGSVGLDALVAEFLLSALRPSRKRGSSPIR